MLWFRCYATDIGQTEFRLVKMATGLPLERVQAVWLSLWCYACKLGEDGSLRGLTAGYVAAEVECPVEDVKAIVQAMVDAEVGLLVREDGHYACGRWQQKQSKDPGAAERMRRYRARNALNGHDNSASVAGRNVLRKKRGDKKDNPPTPLAGGSGDGLQDGPVVADGPEVPPARPSKPRRARRKASEAPGFAEFYAAYPKKLYPADAEKAYRQQLAKGATPEKVLAALMDAVAEWNRLGKDREFIPAPGVWLRKGGWQSVYTPEPSKAPAGPADYGRLLPAARANVEARGIAPRSPGYAEAVNDELRLLAGVAKAPPPKTPAPQPAHH